MNQVMRKPLVRKLLLAVILVVGTLLVLEGAIRIFSYLQTMHYTDNLASTLNVYQKISPEDHSLWVLKPGYKATLQESIIAKEQEGRTLGSAQLQEGTNKYGYSVNDTLFQINAFGFKGPDIQLEKTPGKLRIITIGDSCTFGTGFDRYNYPRELETYLNAHGVNCEVINAGVEGYSTTEVKKRLDYFMSFKPDIALVYIGWNDLYSDIYLKSTSPIYIIRAINKVASFFSPTESKVQLDVQDKKMVFTDHYYDATTKQAEKYTLYSPSFSQNLRDIIDKLKANGIQPVLVTLPGLFRSDTVPSQEAIKIGHLPQGFKNAYVLAVATHNYNGFIRQLASNEKTPLVDLEQWALGALNPPEKWFGDSVHLYPEGQAAIGDYIAESFITDKLVTAGN